MNIKITSDTVQKIAEGVLWNIKEYHSDLVSIADLDLLVSEELYNIFDVIFVEYPKELKQAVIERVIFLLNS